MLLLLLRITSHVRSTNVFRFIFNDDFSEQIVLFVKISFLGLSLTDSTRSFTFVFLSIVVQIVQIDLVGVLVFKSVQRAIATFLKEELTQIRTRDKIVLLHFTRLFTFGERILLDVSRKRIRTMTSSGRRIWSRN